MTNLDVTSVEVCIMAAYQQYLGQTPGDFEVDTSDGKVTITCQIIGTQFNCGAPGYDMNVDQSDQLRKWCITHPGDGWSFGFRGPNETHQNMINITLIDQVPDLMFVYHVNL